jgi:hypothetical protein
MILDSVPLASRVPHRQMTASSKSVMASPPPVLDMHISVDLQHMTEVPEVEGANER